MSNNTMTHQDFKQKLTIFIGTVKETWELATTLSVAAIEHYLHSEDHDTSWMTDLEEAFLNIEGGRFNVAFEKLTKECTNVKYRLNEDSPEDKVKAVTRGSNPQGWASILEAARRDGIQKYAKIRNSRSKSTAARLNNDFEKVSKKVASTGSDTISLQNTENGDLMVDMAKKLGGLDETQRKAAEAAIKKASDLVIALSEGKEIEDEPVKGSIQDLAPHLDEVSATRLQKLIVKMDDLASASADNEVVGKKLNNLLKSAEDNIQSSHIVALAILAGKTEEIPRSYQAK